MYICIHMRIYIYIYRQAAPQVGAGPSLSV